jgi:hypothetical protein
MQVDSILAPGTVSAAYSASRGSSGAPSTFTETLAASMSGPVSAHHQAQAASDKDLAKPGSGVSPRSDPKSEAEPGAIPNTDRDSSSSSHIAGSGSVNTGGKPNSTKGNPRRAIGTEAEPAAKSGNGSQAATVTAPVLPMPFSTPLVPTAVLPILAVPPALAPAFPVATAVAPRFAVPTPLAPSSSAAGVATANVFEQPGYASTQAAQANSLLSLAPNPQMPAGDQFNEKLAGVTSTSSQTSAPVPDNSNASTLSANSSASTEESSIFPDVPVETGRTAPKANSRHGLPAQPIAATVPSPSQLGSGARGVQTPTQTDFAAGDSAPVSQTIPPSDSQFRSQVPNGAAILTMNSVHDVSSIPAGVVEPAVPTAAIPVSQVLSAPVSASISITPVKQSIPSAGESPIVDAVSSAFDPLPIASFAASVIATPQSQVSDNDPAAAVAPATTKQFAVAQSGTFKENPVKLASAPINRIVEEASLPAIPDRRDAIPVRQLSSDSTTAAQQPASAQESGFVFSSTLNNASSHDANNDVSSPGKSFIDSGMTTNASVGAVSVGKPSFGEQGSAALAANNNAGASDKAVVSSPQASAAVSQSLGVDKKSIVANPPNAALFSVAAMSSATQTAPAVMASGKDSSAALIVPPPTVSTPSPQVSSPGAAAALPQAHQMLDSGPAPIPAAPSAPIVPGSAADVQMNSQINAQMHMGLHTDAFGAVEIHTVVQQSQIGITVHADRDITRWFTSEVPSLASGLDHSHLNLTGVNFDSGRSGVQTSAGFSQGQPRQSYSQTQQSPVLAGVTSPEQDTASRSSTVDILPSDLSVRSGVNHVSIHA